jgi:hypothetical protein
MKLEKLFSMITDIKENDIVSTSKTFKSIEEKYYSDQKGYCEACAVKNCKAKLVIERTDIKAFKEDLDSFAKKIKTQEVYPDFDIGIVITRCNTFKKLFTGGIDAKNNRENYGGRDRKKS